MKKIALSVGMILLVVILLAIGIVSLVGCGGSSGGSSDDNAAITTTINAFNAAYNTEDYNSCLTLAYGWTEGTRSSVLSTIQMARTFSGPITISSITDISVTGSSATASVTSSTTNPDTDGKYSHTQTQLFQKDGGTWKYLIY